MTAGAARSPASGAGRRRSRAESAAWMRGAAEAFGVLSRRGTADRLRAAGHAIDLLIRAVEPADWHRAGLGVLPARAPASPADGVPVGDPVVLHLARTAMTLRCSTLPTAERPRQWVRLAGFFAQVVPSADPLLHPLLHRQLRRLEATVLFNRMETGAGLQEVVEGLSRSYEWHRDTYGRHAYLTSLARTNLAIAYRMRAAGTDLADADGFCREEITIRTSRYGPEHPFTLVARSLLARNLLAQAEAAGGQRERHDLARQAYAEADRVRAARDRLYGVTSSGATLSRRLQGHALLLLGEPTDLNRARACLRYVLAFETSRNGNTEWRGSGRTHLLLARACLALGDRSAALDHARNAWRLLAADAPAGPSCREAAALLRNLSGTHGDGGITGSAGHKPSAGS